MNNLNPLSYNVFVLIGVTGDDKMSVVSYTDSTPSQDEVDKIISQANGAYKGFLLLSPVNVIDRPNAKYVSPQDASIKWPSHGPNGVKITVDGEYSLLKDSPAKGCIQEYSLSFHDDNFARAYFYDNGSTVSISNSTIGYSSNNSACAIGAIGGCNYISK